MPITPYTDPQYLCTTDTIKLQNPTSLCLKKLDRVKDKIADMASQFSANTFCKVMDCYQPCSLTLALLNSHTNCFQIIFKNIQSIAL